MSRAQQFADALQTLERDEDLDAFLERFSPDVQLVRPEHVHSEKGQQAQGIEGARAYWQAYLAQFSEIASTFSRVVDAEALGELEWVSRGTLSTGRQIEYAGVSLLEHDEDGKVTRFATYYDTAAFTSPS